MLEIQRVTGGYGDTVVVRDVDLIVPDGAIVALLGPNGAGKTTLLRLASGLIAPMSGSVLLNDDDITPLRPSKRAQLGVCHIPEGRGIFPSLSVRENLRMQAARGREDEALELAATSFPVLGRRLGQQAGTLSGGEQQMLAVVRAYISNPRVVLVDEVSLGLAPLIVDQLFQFLLDLAAGGAALVIVEQYVSRALAIADDVYLLSRGRIVFEGTPAELQEGAILETYMGGEVAPTEGPWVIDEAGAPPAPPAPAASPQPAASAP